MTEVSASLKAARAVDGDDWFVARMKVLCVTEGIEYSQRLAYMTALSVADKIQVDEFMTVDTTGVTDDELHAAVVAVAEEIGAVHTIPTISEQIQALTVRVDALEPVAAWSPDSVAYKVGDLVLYESITYECRQPHTSQAGWIPSGLPALWTKQ